MFSRVWTLDPMCFFFSSVQRRWKRLIRMQSTVGDGKELNVANFVQSKNDVMSKKSKGWGNSAKVGQKTVLVDTPPPPNYTFTIHEWSEGGNTYETLFKQFLFHFRSNASQRADHWIDTYYFYPFDTSHFDVLTCWHKNSMIGSQVIVELFPWAANFYSATARYNG